MQLLNNTGLGMKTTKFRNYFIFNNVDCDFNKTDKTRLVKLGECWHKLDTNGNLSENKIKCDNLMKFMNSNLIVMGQNGKEGLINDDFNIIIKPQYNTIEPYIYSEYITVYQTFTKGGITHHLPAILDLKGNFVLNFKYDNLRIISLEPFLLIAELNNKYGVINLKDETIIPFEYEVLRPCEDKNNKYLIASKGYSNYGIIDINNNIIVPFEDHCRMCPLSDETFIKSYDKFTHTENLIFDFATIKFVIQNLSLSINLILGQILSVQR